MAVVASSDIKAHWLPDRQFDLIEDSIGQRLRRNAQKFGDRNAIFWVPADGHVKEAITYRDLLARAEQAAGWLLEHTQVGDRIAIWSVNNLEFAVLLQATALAGLIAAPYNPGWTDEEVYNATKLTTPALIFVGRDGLGQDLAERTAALAGLPIYHLSDLSGFAGRDEVLLPELDASHPYLIQFTSGTTGSPKGATLSHRAALIGSWLSMAMQGPTSEQDVWLTPVPFHHISGSCSVSLGALAVGGAYVLMEKFNPAKAVSLIEPCGVTRMGGVPTMWHDILNHPDLPKALSISVVGLGGAMVSAELASAIEKRTNGIVSIILGMSECPAVTVTGPDDDVDIKVNSIGRPIPHAEVKIIDIHTGEILPCNEVGEICVRGPMVMDGYWDDPVATANVIDADGFYHTGDLGSMAADGMCRIFGREREMIIRGGENIYPIEIENALMRHPAVASVGVIGVPDARLGERVAAVIKLKPQATSDERELRDHVGGYVSYFKVPEFWFFIEDMPMTASGKVRKVDLEQRYAACS